MAVNQSLYNKYRPTTFENVVGQGNAITVLKSIISKQSYKFNRSYLFHSSIGGVGKTTMARIFAKAVNCLNPKDGNPCNQCNHCREFDEGVYVDFTGVDGKDYNTLEKIKPLVELAKLYPQRHEKGGMRVILIDEAQRMSTQAMSEFLTLFEFSANHTIFIMTTTEVNKILHPIQTRCFKQEVKVISTSAIQKRLESICMIEKIKFNQTDTLKIAEEAGGSLREAIQLLSQFYEAYGEIVDLPLSSKSDQFSVLLETAMLGQVELLSDQLAQLSASTLYEDFSKYLFNHQRNNIRLIQDFLLYKPCDFSTMLLFLTMVGSYDGMITPVKQEVKKEMQKPADTLPTDVPVPDSWETQPATSTVEESTGQTVEVDYEKLGFKKVK